jgi:transposase
MTLMTSLSDPELPVIATLHKGSNTQWDFADFVVSCLENKHLNEGDYFIVDNATVHNGQESFIMIYQLLSMKGVKLIFLPKYSPELNPCELVFAQIKRYLKEHREVNDTLLVSILKGAARISTENIYNYYNKCHYNF